MMQKSWKQWLHNAAGLLALLFVAVLAVSHAVAQIGSSAAIDGTVTDSTGAVVVGAKVTAKSETTGAQLTRTSNKNGLYTLSPLDPGTYTISVTAQGFETEIHKGVHVDGMQLLALDMALKVGTANATVTVTDVPPPLETENATLGSVMENQVYQSLPLEMGAAGSPDQRRATDFAALMPGVSSSMTKNNETSEPMVVNGNAFSSEMYIEGIPVTSVSVAGDPRYIWTAFSVEAVDQFQLKTSAYSAEFRGLGVENFTIKGGGNKYHGSAYDVVRNTAFDAIGYLPSKDQNGNWLSKASPEHMNEYGISLSGPIWKDKVFLFGNYMGFRFSSMTRPQYQNMPTQAMIGGDFSALLSQSTPVKIYDPTTQTCASSSNCTNQQFAYKGSANVINPAQLSPIAQNLAAALQPLYASGQISNSLYNNYVGSYSYGLNNWTTSERLDVKLNDKHSFTGIFGWGRQGLIGSSSQTTNVGPLPYRNSKSYHPVTKDVMLEYTWLPTETLVNQLKYAALQYHAPTINQTYGVSAYEAVNMGIKGLPSYGQAGLGFPDITFTTNSSSADVAYWGPQSGNTANTDNFTVVDTLQWIHGKHSITAGGQYQWLGYNYMPTSDGSSPLALTFKLGETAGYNKSKTATANTGYDFASFMIGAVDSASYQEYALSAQETGTRFHPFAFYLNDDWKVNGKLTINAGLRWDYLPSMRESQDRLAFLNPTATNPYTGTPGALAFAGNGTAGCNCHSPIKNSFKNFGPRLGFAYQLNEKTVIRASAGMYYALGGGVGGTAQSSQPDKALLLGFSASPAPSSQGYGVPAFYLNGSSYYTNSSATVLGVANDPTNASFGGAGYTVKAPPIMTPGYGTYYSTASVSPDNLSTTLGYLDPHYGGRAPQFIGWTFGFQRQVTRDLTLTVSYVGNEGHFLMATGTKNGINGNQIDPKYLSLGANLSAKATASAIAAAGVSMPYASFPATATISQMLKPFPQYNGITDEVDSSSNSDYQSLQMSVNQRLSHGLTLMVNYTFAKNIDDTGTFRTGYAIPTGVAANNKQWAYAKADRSLSTLDLRHNITGTATYDLPFGKGKMASGNPVVSAIAGGWRISGIYSYVGGLPLTITQATCSNNGVGGTCMPAYTAGWTGSARQNGSWGHGANRNTLGTTQYINPAAFTQTGVANTTNMYLIGDAARTAPYGLRGPGNTNIDASMRRTFNVWQKHDVKFVFEANAFNVANHTWFGSASTNATGSINQIYGNSNFGTVAGQANNPRQWQFAGHLNF